MNLIFVRPRAKTTKICFEWLPQSEYNHSPWKSTLRLSGLKAGVCSGLILSAPFTLL